MMAGALLTYGVLALASAALVKYLFFAGDSTTGVWWVIWSPRLVERQFREFGSIRILKKQRRNKMHNKSIAKPSIAAVLALTAALGPAWARPSTISLPAQTSGTEQTLTGTVGDSKCKGQAIDRKAVTLLSCTYICTHSEGRDYVLATRDAVYVLKGHSRDLDRFGGGRATITGRVDGNTILVDSVSSVKKG
jgi:hypothetical protein